MRIPTYQQLSKEQDTVTTLPLEGSYLVTGPPGTGKTVIALYRASSLEEKSSNVLLLMYSALLKQYTEAATGELDLSSITTTFHRWVWQFYKKYYGGKPPQPGPYLYDWMTILDKINTNSPPASSLPYVLIDEGQDLPKEFYLVAQHMSRNLTIFADEHQQIMDDHSSLKEIATYSGIADNIHPLTRNYRNTREIAAFAGRFYSGPPSGMPALPNREGEMPQVRRFSDMADAVDFIARFERNNDDLEIGVFTRTKRRQRRFVDQLEGKTTNPVQFYVGGKGKDAPVLDFDEPGIKVVNYPSVKGLEFDVVFIPCFQEFADLSEPTAQMLLYVLASRAREQLIISYVGWKKPDAFNYFPDDGIEWV